MSQTTHMDGDPATQTQAQAWSDSRISVAIHAPSVSVDGDSLLSSTDDGQLGTFVAATGHILWTAGPNGAAQDVLAWCAYTGQCEEDARGAGWLDAIHPEDRARAALAWVRVVETREPYEVEYRLRRRDGVYRAVIALALPLYDTTGGVREWIGSCTDVWDLWRGRSQTASNSMGDTLEIRQRERHTHEALRALLAIAESLVLPRDDAEADIEAKETEVSLGHKRRVGHRLAALTRYVLGCERILIVGNDPTSGRIIPFAAAGLAPQHEERWRAVLAGHVLRDRLPATIIERLAAGELIMGDFGPSAREWIGPRGLLVPLKVGGNIVGLLGAGYPPEKGELTEDEHALAETVARLTALFFDRDRLLRQRAEARAGELAMRESKRQMDEFLSIASHELKTPLTSIRGFIQVAKQRLKALDQEDVEAARIHGTPTSRSERFARVHSALERAEYQTGQMTRLINELLDASRIHANRMELRLARRDLGSIVRDAIEEQRLVRPGREIIFEATADRIMVQVDAGRIGQVLTNFLTNALKYAPADRPVRACLVVEGGAAPVARVSVRDFGPGLAPDALPRIWERFYRAPEVRALQGNEGGLGLGLYITRGIVEAHGGAVGVESAPGEGSTFYFTLPLAGQA